MTGVTWLRLTRALKIRPSAFTEGESMTGMMWGRTPSGKAAKVQVTEEGAVVVSGAVGGGRGGTSNTTEATQLDVLAKAASIDDKTPR